MTLPLFKLILYAGVACFVVAECLGGTLRKAIRVPISQLHRRVNLRDRPWYVKGLEDVGLVCLVIGTILELKS